MRFDEILPEDAIKKLSETIKIWFRTPKQTEKIREVLKPYQAKIEVFMELDQLVTFIEKAVELGNNGSSQHKGKRVLVHDGSGVNVLGYGTYVGDSKVWAIQMPNGSLQSCKNAEMKPQDIPPGGKLIQTDHNPKIILDNGQIVYGCQVWWEPVQQKDELNPKAEIDITPKYQWN